MHALRQIMLALMAAMMILTSGGMAVARGQSETGTAMVICNGMGLVTIQVDANGDKIDPTPICPECMLSHADLPQGALKPAALLNSFTRLARLAHAELPLSYEAVQASARGPPVSL